MHMQVPLSIAQQEIEDHKQQTIRLTTQAFSKYTEAMAESVVKYKDETEHMVSLHVQETSTLLAIALETNARQHKYIAQQHTENAKKIAQLEAQLASERMNSSRCYMTDSQKTTGNTTDPANLDLWQEKDDPHDIAWSVEEIHDFMQLPMFDSVN